jgi:hypothetical protein
VLIGGLCLVIGMQDQAEMGHFMENPTTVVKRDEYCIGQDLNSDLRPELAPRHGVLGHTAQSEARLTQCTLREYFLSI